MLNVTGVYWEPHVFVLGSTRQVVGDGSCEGQSVRRLVESFSYTQDVGP